MRCKLRIPFALLAVASLVGATAADAAIIVTNTVNVAPAGGAAHDPYDPATDASGSGPMLTASSIDLVQGLTEAGGGISTYRQRQSRDLGRRRRHHGRLARNRLQSGW